MTDNVQTKVLTKKLETYLLEFWHRQGSTKTVFSGISTRTVKTQFHVL